MSTPEPSRSEPRIRRQRTGRVVEGAAWLTVACLTGFVATVVAQGPSVASVNAVAAALPLAFGIRVFLVHGGTRITALGLFNFACGIFVGYAGLHQALAPGNESSQRYLTWTILASFGVQVISATLAHDSARSPAMNVQPIVDTAAARWLVRAGGVLLAGLLAARHLGGSEGSVLVDGTAFTAVALIATGEICRESPRPFALSPAIVAGAFIIYAESFHEGNGRLRLVALACTVAILYAARFPRRWMKLSAVAVAPLCVAWLAMDRLRLQEALRPGSSEGRSGLESMFEPITTFTKVVEAQASQSLPLGLGRTFLSIPFAILPDELSPRWAPTAIGYELVKITHPSRVGTTYSTASTVFGEWTYNFSIFGLALLVPALVWLLVLLDNRFAAAAVNPSASRRRLLWLVLMAMLCGSVADLVWSGLHTFVARGVLRLPPLLALALLAVLTERVRRHEPAGKAAADPGRAA